MQIGNNIHPQNMSGVILNPFGPRSLTYDTRPPAQRPKQDTQATSLTIQKKEENKHVEHAYDASLQNFAQANKNNAATFSNLPATNAQMANNIAAAVQTLQQHMEQSDMAVNINKAGQCPPGFNQPAIYLSSQQYQGPRQYMPPPRTTTHDVPTKRTRIPKTGRWPQK